MIIAFVLSNSVLSPSNGIVSQALTWKRGLEQNGHEVHLIDMWKKNDWKNFDVIHFYGFSIYMRDFIIGLSKVNPNIVVSPILDPDYSITRLKIYTRWGSTKFNLKNQYFALYSIKDKIPLFLGRSVYEKDYISKGFNLKQEQCKIVPLSYNFDTPKEVTPKENFCLHISLLTDERKNVKRLIEASKKYNFRLILGGKVRSKQELDKIQDWIGGNSNIEYLGYLSELQLKNLYSRAKVFALPSINEGVGIVALEAASMGCDIVITNLGGPKEYYGSLAKIVDPYSVDEIGTAIVQLLNGFTFQPQLQNYIRDNFSLSYISKRLESCYESLYI